MIKDYVLMARPDHWFKNVFMLPGVLIALLLTGADWSGFGIKLFLGIFSTCLIASANYVINEWVDAKYDRFHPIKRDRPAASKKVVLKFVVIEYIVLLFAGLYITAFVSKYFMITMCVFVVAGIVYNIEPIRVKDRPYLDVLTESINNPIRLLLGWFIVTEEFLPPSSLLYSYWMGGAFLMGVKRYAEMRYLGKNKKAGWYRKSFRYYSQNSLMVSILFYATSAAFFLGVFLIKYRVELLISMPFIAILFAWYLHIGYKKESAVQNPEKLYKERSFFVYCVCLAGLLSALFVWDVPWLDWFLSNAFIAQN